MVSRRHFLGALAATALAGCGRREPRSSGTTLVFKHGKLFGDPRALRALIDEFERAHPGVAVREETLPASSDEQHQFYAINLHARSAAFDVLAVDIIWVAGFARAGWLAELDAPEGFFAGPMEAVTWQDKVYALPWFVDAGLLYYRTDLVATPPRSWPELVDSAQAAMSRSPGLHGFVWQGKQYEGLVCNALEYLHSNGGAVLAAALVAGLGVTARAFFGPSNDPPAIAVIPFVNLSADTTETYVRHAFAGMGAVGFPDDYIKIRRNRSLGLTKTAKFVGQALVGLDRLLEGLRLHGRHRLLHVGVDLCAIDVGGRTHVAGRFGTGLGEQNSSREQRRRNVAGAFAYSGDELDGRHRLRIELLDEVEAVLGHVVAGGADQRPVDLLGTLRPGLALRVGEWGLPLRLLARQVHDQPMRVLQGDQPEARFAIHLQFGARAGGPAAELDRPDFRRVREIPDQRCEQRQAKQAHAQHIRSEATAHTALA